MPVNTTSEVAKLCPLSQEADAPQRSRFPNPTVATVGWGGVLHSFAKRPMDLVLSSVFLLVALPFMILVGLFVARDGGPAIYRHRRIGRDGKAFDCLKFRTMVRDSSAILARHLETHPAAAREWRLTQKLRDDPRVTAVGRLLRKTSLDELPQLLNVLKGEMSLVGPRPVTESELDRYGQYVHHYFSVRPGLTGVWQVSGRSNLSYEERVRLDVLYVETRSLWGDLKLIAQTVVIVLCRTGAV